MSSEEMPRYWVIAPYAYDVRQPELWENVWKYDFDNGMISIGWPRLGDVSSLGKEQLRERVNRTYTDYHPNRKAATLSMLWKFYHSIRPGDVIIARQGLKKIAAIGTAVRVAYYERNKNPHAFDDDGPYSDNLDVEWTEGSAQSFDSQVFGMQTIYEIDEEKFRILTQKGYVESSNIRTLTVPEEATQNQTEFALEKYLEDFIASNFDVIFKGKLRLYSDPDTGDVAQQFDTDAGTIDILAQETPSNTFVVVELKKGRESDKVVGQVLRYMGWVAKNLCKEGQDVKGMIIYREPDERLSYAIQMTQNVSVKYYRVDFKLQDHS